ncbi:predicted protein [Sclerotinia sclerotiorum 1980 UF-70]|uniref:Uncharacterized protein n=1 Tax=Sclerotinia sclerotiorum (strain ATCC 18683 / 1980 / Ss-1) TaxID=665079 RepID=A7F840_SCLS1|nr:predicted protein [Sclerotinia sclerotiorum 1980 UF-70]EDN98911.1 predicted protein [Sclerotinia sclerotiorum 1980 UF-70]
MAIAGWKWVLGPGFGRGARKQGKARNNKVRGDIDSNLGIESLSLEGLWP